MILELVKCSHASIESGPIHIHLTFPHLVAATQIEGIKAGIIAPEPALSGGD